MLAALSTYRLLNPQQMLRVGVARSIETIRLEARVLERKGLIGGSPPLKDRKRSKRLVSGVTALPCLHWLTRKGAEILVAEGDGDAIGARREMGDEGHIMHRIRTVDAHIALRQWAATADRKVNWFVTDFEPGSDGRHKATKIDYEGEHGPHFIPDALADLIGPDGHSRLMVLEIERGRRDAKRLSDFKDKIGQLREVSERGIVETTRPKKPKHRARFLVIFATAELRRKQLAAWPDPDADAWANFFVKSDDELADFNAGWWRPGGRFRRPLFSFKPAAQPQTTLLLPVA